MRGFRIVLTFAVLVAVANSADAGIYCSLDQIPYPVPTRFSIPGGVSSTLGDLRAPLNTEQTKGSQLKREEYLKRAEELEAKNKDGILTLDERIDLSGVYLRLKRNDEAIKLLLPFADEKNPFVLTHLATAYHRLDQPLWDRAVFYQQQAIKAWPAVSLRWNLDRLNWYRRAEQYYLELLRSRHQEILANSGRASSDTLDALFPKLRFETPEGLYEIGGPAKRGDRLTEDAPQDDLSIVVQLLFWLPFDNRLTWLYGEMLNQRGDVVDAEKVLNELLEKRKFAVRKIHLHQRALQSAVDLYNSRRELFWAARPPSISPVPVVGDCSQLAGYFLAMETAKKWDIEPERFLVSGSQAMSPTAPSGFVPNVPAPASGTWLPDWRTATVSFVAGMIVMGLVLLQWREWSRRRDSAVSTRRQLTN